MVKLSSNPTCVLSDADTITNEQAERIAKVLTKHLPGADNITEAGKIVGVDANGDVSLVEDNPMPSTSGASQGDVLTVGANGPEWAAPSAPVSTDGVLSGDGSVEDPVVLNVGAGLSSVTSGGTTTFTVTDTVEGYFRLTREQGLSILQSQSPVTVNFTGNGSWECNSAGSEYIFALQCSGNRTVFFNPLRQWNDATYPQPWEGDISAVNYVLDPSNVDTDHGISIQSMVAALEADPTIEYVYLTYCIPQYGYWTTFAYQLSGYSAVFTVPSASGATTSLVVANPVPAYAAGDAGKVLTVNSGATGVEWAAPSGGGTTVLANELLVNQWNSTGHYRYYNLPSDVAAKITTGIYLVKFMANYDTAPSELSDMSTPAKIWAGIWTRTDGQWGSESQFVLLPSTNVAGTARTFEGTGVFTIDIAAFVPEYFRVKVCEQNGTDISAAPTIVKITVVKIA